MTRPPEVRVSFVLLALLFISNIPLVANAQQQHLSQHNGPHAPLRRNTWVNVNQGQSPGISLDQAARKPQQNNNNNKNDGASAHTTDVRALATLAPSGRLIPDGDVRAPLARSAGTTGGLSSRLPARSLQDWKVEDFVLLATVDGTLYARDREKGTARWAFHSEQPMVETTYHIPSTSENGSTDSQAGTRDFYWIVEPSQDGSLYGYTPGSPFGMQKLGMTVKQLVEDLSPYASEDPPVVYTGEKKTTLYTVDAGSGNILKTFSAGYYSYNDEGVCRRGGLEALDDDECGATATLTLGRTEYILGIQSRVTGEPICTIRYFEWGPNNRDKDLRDQYSATKDNRYIYSLHDGRVLALDHFGDKQSQQDFARKPMYKHKFESPVVRVFDVARPVQSSSLDTPLILLPQPIGPAYSDGSFLSDESRVFVNCTAAGSWYALSETEYPMVTDGASPAQCSSDDWIYNLPFLEGSEQDQLKKALVGVHALSYEDALPRDVPRIAGPAPVLEITGNEPIKEVGVAADTTSALRSKTPARLETYNSYLQTVISLVLFILVVVASVRWMKFSHLPFTPAEPSIIERMSAQFATSDDFPDAVLSTTESTLDPKPEVFPEIAVKIVRFQDDNKENEVPVPGTSTNGAPDLALKTTETRDMANGTGDATGKPKKKAHRGKRGGTRDADKRKAKDGSQDIDSIDGIVEGVKQMGQDVTVKPDAVSVASQSNTEGSTGLQNLTFSTDKVLGNGSGGTIVCEGSFEGRDVAVKRMLTVHYELASQEVSLLEQSEDHPNVIRYFCRREDRHFLYIALELCQASLFDLYKDSRIDSMATPDPKFASLVEEINKAPVQALRQLAEGVRHLHALRIVHRDIKPQNMLVAYPKKNSVNTYPRLVISDFGLCKTLPEGASTLIGATVNAGTTGWKAPELISQPRDASAPDGSHNSVSNSSTNGEPQPGAPGVKRAVDIFSLGCVFFYILTRGLHPFDDEEGWAALRERNIKTNRHNFGAIEIHGPDTVDLIRWMLSSKPEDRPTAAEVLAHPFFWNAEDRLEFLSQASDRFDVEPRDGTSPTLNALEAEAEAIISPGPTTLTISSSPRPPSWSYAQHGRSPSPYSSDTNGTPTAPPIPEPNFFAMLDRKFTDTLGKQRKYNGAKLADLLRALRNKYHHWDDMPDDVKAKVGEVPDGYLRYWEQKFPGLVVGVWRVVRGLGLGEERKFWKWFRSRGG